LTESIDKKPIHFDSSNTVINNNNGPSSPRKTPVPLSPKAREERRSSFRSDILLSPFSSSKEKTPRSDKTESPSPRLEENAKTSTPRLQQDQESKTASPRKSTLRTLSHSLSGKK
jgi:hypothetical protein